MNRLHSQYYHCKLNLHIVARERIELSTLRIWAAYSNHLSYLAIYRLHHRNDTPTNPRLTDSTNDLMVLGGIPQLRLQAMLAFLYFMRAVTESNSSNWFCGPIHNLSDNCPVLIIHLNLCLLTLSYKRKLKDSNLRPLVLETSALPAELSMHNSLKHNCYR